MNQICRTCLRVPTILTSLYSDSTLINKIESIASIQLTENENFPITICEECVKNINDFYNFRKVIINSDKELRERCETLEKLKQSKKNENMEKFVIKKEDYNFGGFDNNDYNIDNNEESSQDIRQNEDSDIEETLKNVQFNLKKNKCNLCDKSFTSRFKLYNHKKSKHVRLGVCNICGLTVRADNLKRHIKVHVDQPVQCKECGKVYKNAESLRGHMYQHVGNSFKCDLCNRTFKAKNEYRRHLKIHADPTLDKAVCTVCGKRVKHLRRHMYSHTGERPYLCVYCHKGFSSSGALKVHTRQHTNEKPYICEYCSLGFPQKVSLVTHLKSKHNVT